MGIFLKRRVYLDHAATTPMSPTVLRAYRRAIRRFPGNPGSLSQEGVKARAALRAARASVASILSVQSHQVFFTNGGTDGINRVISGIVAKARAQHPDKIFDVLYGAIEHPAVIETVRHLEQVGHIRAIEIPVSTEGLVEPDAVRKLLREHPDTILVSVQYANNEIGTIHPIRNIAREIRHARSESGNQYPYLFVDAVQAAPWCELGVPQLGVDAMTISGSKIYGPKHSGVMFIRRRDMIDAVTFGGGQEGGVVPGTEDVAGALAFAQAFSEARNVSAALSKRLSILQGYLFETLASVQDVVVNGSHDARLPNNVHVSVRGIPGERLVLELDAAGFAVSAKSACASDDAGISHVLSALGTDHAASPHWGSVRITMGRGTSRRDVERFVAIFARVVMRIRAFDETLKKS